MSSSVVRTRCAPLARVAAAAAVAAAALVVPAGTASAAAEPRGHVDVIDASGTVRGWGCDPDSPWSSAYVRLLVDGVFVGGAADYYPREQAVNDLCGRAAEHGFTGYLPAWATDGRPHELVVQVQAEPVDFPVRDVEIGRHTFVANNRPAAGHLDTAADGTIAGWAFDESSPAASNSVRISIYRDTGSSLFDRSPFVTTVPADQPRADVNADPGIAGNHGFSFPVPAEYRDGTYTVAVTALDLEGNVALDRAVQRNEQVVT